MAGPDYVENIEEGVGDPDDPLNNPSHPQHHEDLAKSVTWLRQHATIQAIVFG